MKNLKGVLITLAIVLFFSAEKSVAQYVEARTKMQGITKGVLKAGDYNNDGYADIFVSGSYLDYTSQEEIFTTILFKNTGFENFEKVNTNLPGLAESTLAIGDYDNDGDLDVFLSGLINENKAEAYIFRNDGNGIFTDTKAKITPVSEGSADWGDYDNDGDLDLIVCGFTKNSPNFQAKTTLYKNNNGVFPEVTSSFVGVGKSSVEWGDFDNDGDLDFAMGGYSVNNNKTLVPTAKIYRNENASNFIDQNAALQGIADGSASWCDYDNDGDLDLLLAGSEEFKAAAIYNNQNGSFSNINAVLPSLFMCSAAWGDYNNDGRSDIVFTGFNRMGDPQTVIFNNLGNNLFDKSEIELKPYWLGDMVLSDFDNDKDLDIIITGFNEIYSTEVYKNTIEQPNNKPATPENLHIVYNADSTAVTFTWDKANDTETPADAITYNLYYGERLSNLPTLSQREFAATAIEFSPGNVGHNRSWTVSGLKKGISYFWTVQAVDNALIGSYYAEEESFIIGMKVDFEASTTNVCAGSTVYFTNTSSNVTSFAWKRDNIVFANSRNASYKFDTPGEYTVTLTARNGNHERHIQQKIKVHALPIAQISQNEPVGICEQDSFIVEANRGNFSYIWQLNDKKITNSFDHVLVCKEKGNYNVIVTDSIGCAAKSEILNVEVYPLPDNLIRTNSPTSFCGGDAANLITESEATIDYKWFYNNTLIENAKAAFYNADKTGSYYAILTNEFGCSSKTDNVQVTVYAIPENEVITSRSPVLCQGETITLKAPQSELYSYQWFLNGDPIEDETKNALTIGEAGSYSVRIKNARECTNRSKPIDVIVNILPEIPVVEYTTPLSFCYGGAVKLETEKDATLTYQWTKDNIDIQDATSPFYIAKGTGTFRLVATNGNNCSISSEAFNVRAYLVPDPVITYNRPTSTICEGDTILLQTINNRDFSYQWFANDKEIPEATTYNYSVAKAANYSVRVTNNMCPATSPKVPVQVLPAPSIQIAPLEQTFVCGEQPFEIKALAEGNPQFEWFRNNVKLEGERRATLVANHPGRYICRSVPEGSCPSKMASVEIYDVATIDFEWENTCQENEIQFYAKSVVPRGAMFYWWEFGDGETSGFKNPTNKFWKPEDFDVKLIVDFNSECSDTIVKTVHVNPTPRVDFTYKTEHNGTTAFSYTAMIYGDFVKQIVWDFGDGKTEIGNIDKAPEHRYQAAGTYNVKVIITAKDDCVTEVVKSTVVSF